MLFPGPASTPPAIATCLAAPRLQLFEPVLPMRRSLAKQSPAHVISARMDTHFKQRARPANAVSLKLDRDFASDKSFEQIATQIFEDESAVFKIMGIEDDRS